MRKPALALLALPATALLAAQSATPAPVRGGTLTVAMNVEVAGGLDPAQVAGAENVRMLHQNVLEGLVGFNEAGRVVPLLATALPQVSADGLTYTFTLRQGVRFHDGSSFDSADVKAKFDRARTANSGQLSPSYYADIASVTATDADTVVFRLSKVNTDFLLNLGRAESVIYPSELLANAQGLESLKTRPIGTGPFQFDAWNRGSNLRIVRNPNYYVRGLPYLDAVVFRFLGDDQNAKVAALRSGDLDAIGYNVPAEQANTLRQDQQFRVLVGVSSGEITVTMNSARRPFNDVRVRRAFTHAMNKREIVDGAFFGFGTVIGSFNSPGQPYYIDLANKYPYNAERARELLAQAGYPNGLTVRFTVANEFPIERRTAEVYAAQLQRVGVTAQIELVPFNTWLTRVFTGRDYDMTIIGHAEAGDLDRYARDPYYFNYTSRQYRDLYARALTTPNEAQRTRIYWQMQNLLADDAPSVWALSAPYIAATRANVYGLWRTQPIPNTNVVRAFKTAR